jgi:hypothetical protein
MNESEIAFERRKQHAAWVFIAAVAGMLMVSALVGYVVFQGRPETATPYEAGRPGAASRAGVTPAVQSGPIRIEIHATGVCLVSAEVDGRKVLGRVLQPGERTALTANQTALITVSDAGAFVFTLNGRPGRPLGGPGQSGTARITRETLAGYQR